MVDDDLVFRALADPTRRRLLDALQQRDGRTLTELEQAVPELSRFGVMKHLRVLEEAGLVVARKQGRFRHHHLNAVPIQGIADRWIDRYRAGRAAALLDLQRVLEERHMSAPGADTTQIYRLYIRARPQQVWDAITDPSMIGRFFHGGRFQIDAREGGRIHSTSADGTTEWGNNTILRFDPPRKLVHTWRSLYRPDLAREPESRVSWEVEAMEGGFTRLTVTHDQLDRSPKTAASVQGWSYILSSLKSVLETGEPLPPFPG